MSASGTATRPEGRAENCRPALDQPLRALREEGDCFCWFQQDIPVRLQPSDLHNPGDFHRRLSNWLLQQR